MPSAIQASPDRLTLRVGESRVVEVSVLPEEASQEYTARIQDTGIAVLGGSDPSPDPGPKPVTGITLDRTSYSGVAGSTLTLHATVSPSDADDATVSWRSDATGVASVSGNGVVALRAAGRAVITASAGGYTASCAVTVTAATVAVQSVTVSSRGGVSTLDVGSTLQLSATVLPVDATDRTVTWSASPTTVATVSRSGLVTGVEAGTVTVTATAGGRTGSLTLTVRAVTVERENLLTTPPSLPLTANGVTMSANGDGSYHLKGTATAWTGFAFTAKKMSAGTYSLKSSSANLLSNTGGIGFWVRPDELDARLGNVTREYTSTWWQNAHISVNAGTSIDTDVTPRLTREDD